MKTMIKNKSVLFSMLASVMMMSACSSEDGMTTADNSNPTTGRVMYAKGAYNDSGNSQSRMSYGDDFTTNHLTLAWSEGDAFSAFINGNTTKYNFAIQAPQSGTYTASESFKCDNFATEVTDGTIVDAIYPAVAADAVNPQNITLSLAEQAQDGNKSTAHLKNYDYMVGHATYNASKPDELDFNFRDKGDGNSGRLASIYRIRLLLPATVTSVSKIVISCTDVNNNSSLVTSEKVNFTNGSTSAVADAKGDVTLNITNGTPEVIEDVNTFVAYAMLFPSAVKTRTITVTTTDSGAEKIYTDTKTYDSETIYTRGQFKYIDVDLVPKNLKSAYVLEDFKDWSEENCKDAPSYEDIQKYLGAGVYWDNGDEGDDGHQQTYTVDGTTCHAGLWMKKMLYIKEDVSLTETTPKNGRPSTEEIDNYFFLPAAGYHIIDDELGSDELTDGGSLGYYWLKTQSGNSAYGLFFGVLYSKIQNAEMHTSSCGHKYLPMVKE